MAEPRAHSRFGGSSTSRWMNCPGSVALCETVPEGASSSYAVEGTLAHAFAEWALRQGERSIMMYRGGEFPFDVRSANFVKGQVAPSAVTDDMASAVQAYLDAVWAEVDASPDAELFIEQGFVLDIKSAELGEVFGTNDALVYSAMRGRLAVFDYKHGAGVSVDVKDNTQLKFYAAGAALAKPWKLKEIELFIVQPRARDADEVGAVKPWKMDPFDLMDFIGELEIAVQRVKVIGGINEQLGDLQVGSWCRWCPAASICPAKEQEALGVLAGDFASVADISVDKLVEPKVLDVERLAAILKAIDVLEGYGQQVRTFVEEQMLAGVKIPGWKVVEKVGRRKWTGSDEEIADYLGLRYEISDDDLRPRKLVGLTEAERLLKAATGKDYKAAKDDLTLRYTVKESSGRTIALASDKRDAIDAVATDFGSVQIDAS